MRVRERDAAGAVRGEQARDTDHRVLAERQRIEEVVVHPPVDHVDAPRAARRAHEHGVVLDEEILPFDQFHAHLLREERVLEVGGVVRARRHHGDGRIVLGLRTDGAEVLEQHVRVVLDRPDRTRGEELGEEPHHHLAVLEHVRHAGRHPQVVLQHVVLARAGADDVDARDVRVDAARNVHAGHLAPVLRIAEHALGGNGAGLQDLLVVVDVVQEEVERAHALLQTLLEDAPLVRRNDARHDVERDQALGAGILPVDGERDADPVERALGLFPFLRDAGCVGPLEPVRECPVMRADSAVVGGHFIVGADRHID